jgi:tetratricopeptide (TPR) repeat protein
MPYFGARTLADLVRQLRDGKALPDSGRALLSTRSGETTATPEAVGGPLPEPPTVDLRGALARGENVPRAAGPRLPAPARKVPATLQMLEGLGYVDAVLWIAARLADGLAHAHEHGVVHCDLKPANVLLSDDGQPMLLDFNVAVDTERGPSVGAALLGGTLRYMAPEHLTAMQQGIAEAHPQYDLFAFGVILYELLTGRQPFQVCADSAREDLAAMIAERRQPPPRVRPWNPAVSPAVEAIVRHCLEPEPGRRYQTAQQLREDLERQRANLPLKHVAEPSLRERARKWMRRHPRLASSTSVSVVALVLLAALGWHFVARGAQLAAWEAQAAAQVTWGQHQDDLQLAQYLLYTRVADPQQVEKGKAVCSRALERYQVANPSWLAMPAVSALPERDQEQLREDVGELLLLLARATALPGQQAGAAGAQPDRVREALRWNTLAETCSPGTAATQALWRQRAELTALLGDQAAAKAHQARADALPLRSARDHYWSASESILQGRHRAALPLLQKATRLEPRNFWAWFVLGSCYDRLGQDVRAEACYSTCISLWPAGYWSYFNRGLAHLRQQAPAAACEDFDEVLRLRPDLTDAYLNRALARQGLKQYAEALQDFTLALKHGAPDTRIYFMRARVREKMKDAEGARRDFEEGMRREPADELSWIARGLARMPRDPKAALGDFERALQLNPRSNPGLQNKAHVLAERLGRPEEALAVLDRAVALYPEAAPLRSGRGVVRARLGRREAALKDAEDALARDASPARLYQVACIYALTSQQQADDRFQAFRLLTAALRKGYGLDLLESDSDLGPLRKQPEFGRLAEAARALRSGVVQATPR